MTFLHEASSYSVTNVYIRAASIYVFAAKLTAAGDLLCWMCRTNSADNSQLAKPQRSARVESPGQGLPPTPALNTSKVQSNGINQRSDAPHVCAERSKRQSASSLRRMLRNQRFRLPGYGMKAIQAIMLCRKSTGRRLMLPNGPK